MTDIKKQQELMEMIERMLADDSTVGPEARGDAAGRVYDEEMDRLLALAEELSGGRPEPTAEFQERLGSRMAELKAGNRSSVSAADDRPVAPGDSESSGNVRWLPQWLTMPRVAAVAASLLIGLGLVGMTGALIRGGYQDRTTADSNAVIQSRGADEDSKAMENAVGGSAPARDGDIAVDDGSGYAATDVNGSSGSAGGATVEPLPSDQRIIQTADYRIEIVPGEFDEKYAQITAIAVKYGGYVVSGDTRMGTDELKSGSIIIRVANANDNFSRAQAEVDSLGNVSSKKISGQDITEEYVDLQSRLRNAEVQEAQYLALMQRAQTIDEILTVQSRLADVQSQIEQIKGRMKYMEGRTDFATISITMREAIEGDEPDDGGTNWGFIDSIEYAGWLAVQTLNFVIVALGIIVPLTVMAGGLALLVYRVAQKRRARKAADV